MFSFNFKLESGDLNTGTVYLPNETTLNAPVIVYCHGWGGNRQIGSPIDKLCERAMKENICIVTFDFFGCGETGGDYSYMTYTRWMKNLSDVLSWVASQPFSNENKIGFFAISSGTTAALKLAAVDTRPAFIISIATCISTHFGMNTGGPSKLLAENLEKLTSGGTATIFGVDFGIDFYIDTVKNAPIYSMGKIKCPVLFLQGTADNTFRCADAKIAHDLMKYDNLNSTYIEIKDGNHSLDNMADIAIENTFNWIMPIL
jgi:pimeloyl-ACP methyl ester carboxylesterase